MLKAIKKGIEWLRKDQHTFTIINAALTVLIAATAAVATIVQAWFSASHVSPLPQVQARSISELRVQIEDRRKSMEREIKQLDELLKDIGRAEAVLRGVSPQTGATPQMPAAIADAWWLSALKTVAVYMVLVFTVTFTVFAVAIDLLALLLGYDFPALRALWGWSWNYVTIEWYWQPATAAGVAAGLLLIGFFGFLTSAMDKRSARDRDASDSGEQAPQAPS